jgi:hypothetical protein
MLKKSLLLFLLFPILLTNSCQKTPLEPASPEPAPLPQFSQRIKKVIRHVTYPGTGFSENIFQTEYFYDAQGRVDSIYAYHSGQKVLYAPNGKVEKLLRYDYYNTRVGAENTYQYDSEDRVESITMQYFDENGQPSFQSQQFFEYDNEGFVVKEWHSNSNDKTVITRENGNAVKNQRFYNANGEEHWLSIAAFDDKFNPEYAVGMNSIYPGEFSPNNTTFAQIVHWDCGDYDPSPRNYTLIYNDEGLPLKSEETSGNYWVEYIYE